MKPTNKTNKEEKKVLGALKSPLFFALTILLTVFAAFRLLSGKFPVIDILWAIFAWIVYLRATKDICDVKSLRVLSGVIFADFIIGLVGSVNRAITGVFIIISKDAKDALLQNTEFLNYVKEDMEKNGGNFIFDNLEIAVEIIGVLYLIFCIFEILINLFGVKSIHSFVKSVYKGVESGKIEIKKRKTAQVWLMIFGIISAIGALATLITTGFSDFIGFIESGAFAAVCICLFVFIKKNFNK